MNEKTASSVEERKEQTFFVAAESSNVEDEIFVSDLFETKREAVSYLKDSYEAVVTTLKDDDNFAESYFSAKAGYYYVDSASDDHFFGVIRKVKR